MKVKSILITGTLILSMLAGFSSIRNSNLVFHSITEKDFYSNLQTVEVEFKKEKKQYLYTQEGKTSHVFLNLRDYIKVKSGVQTLDGPTCDIAFGSCLTACIASVFSYPACAAGCTAAYAVCKKI